MRHHDHPNRRDRRQNHLAVGALAILATASASAQTGPLIVDPPSAIFCGQPGQAVASIPFTISTLATPVQFITTGVTSDGDWLTVNPSFATANATPSYQLVLGLKGGLIPFANGIYRGQVILSRFDGSRLTAIPVTLQVDPAGCGAAKTGLFYSSSGPLTFQLPPGALAGQDISLFNTFPTSLTAIPADSTDSGGDWLTTIKLNLTIVRGLQYPFPLRIGVSSQGLSPGIYTGNIGFDTSNASFLNIPVTLAVNPLATTQLSATPSPLTLGVETGTGTASAVFQLTNLTGVAANVSLKTNERWMLLSPDGVAIPPFGTATFAAIFRTAGLVRGPNKGQINAGTLTIPFTVNYGIEPRLTPSLNPVNISGAGSQDLTITAAGQVSFTATATSGVNKPWLTVQPGTAIASAGSPVKLTVNVNSALLPPGPAVGVITLTPTDGSSPLIIPVNVNAGLDPQASLSPAQLAFTSAAPQTLSLTAPFSGAYAIQPVTLDGGNWLQVNPPFTMGPSTVTVQANPAGLAAQTYQGRVIFTNVVTGAQQSVPVTLTVAAPPAIAVSPAALRFRTPAASQSVQLSSVGASLPFTAQASSLLTVTPASGTTPATLTVAVNPSAPASVAPGEYPASVIISSPGIATQTIPVTIVVAPQIGAIVNAASLQPGPVSPGEIVTLYGDAFGPDALSVTFDSFTAPVIYVGAKQINAIVPYEIAGQPSTQLVVTRNGVASPSLALQVVETQPAIFAGILNGDNSFNQVARPAAPGSVIQIFATGEGLVPGAITGSVTPPAAPFRTPSAPVSLTIDGQPAQILFVGEAPGLISGVLQVNAVIPDTPGPAARTVVLKAGDRDNQAQAVTIQVR